MKTEQQLDEALSRLTREIEPSRDLWPDIAGQLTPRQERHWRDRLWSERRWHEWGGVAAAVLLGVGLWQQWPSDDGMPVAVTPSESGQIDSERSDSMSVDDQLHAATAVGLSQGQQQLKLAQQLELQQLQQIPPGFSNWQQQLAIWQQASEQVELALQAEPENSRLIKQFNQLQQQQLNYIRKLVSTSQLS